MDLIKLHSITEKPAIYEKGNAVMWDDEHISKILLEAHLGRILISPGSSDFFT
ncbi:hypothetical protein [Methanoplanus limicola]|uniref:hypothetical protein n=1 Tax=Methanoplanus limicola TaxID=2315 RepID=UPI0012F64195|nr:hypothetical protein [Methanoplanus limicola]